MQSHIEALEKKHRQLDRQVKELSRSRGADSISVQALKKLKLTVKDKLEDARRQHQSATSQ
jgi:hypothetical protein